jgi:TolA-binding protein
LRILIISALICALSIQCFASEEEDLAFAIGVYNDGLYDVAEPAFASFVKKYRYSDKRPYALYLLGVTRFILKRYPDAKEAMKELIQLYPKYERIALAKYYLGEASYMTDDLKTALNAYKYVYKNIPEEVSRETVLFRLGELNFVSGDYEGAKSVLTELRKEKKDFEHTDIVRLYLSFSYYYTKDYKNAFPEFKYVLTKPELIKDVQGDVLYFIGDSAFYLKKYNSAAKYFTRFLKSVKRDKRRELARYFNAMSLYFINNKETALKELKRYFTDYPRGRYISDVIEQLANIYFEVKRYKKAIEYFSKLIELQPKSKKRIDWLLKTAWCYTNTKEHKKASGVYDRLEKEYGGKGVTDDISFLRAESYYMSKEYNKAIKIYEKLKGNKKYKKDVLVKLGDCHFYLDDHYMSKRYYLEFMKSYSGQASDDTLLKLAISLQHELKPDEQGEALKYYEKIIAKKRGDYYYKTALYNAVIFYDKADDAKKLKPALQKYVDTKGVDVPPYFYLRLANAYYNEDQRKKAIKYYKAAVKSNIANVMGESLFKLGKLYHKENDLKKALEHFNLAEGSFSKSTDIEELTLIYLERGSIYEKQKIWALAKGEYVKVTEMTSDEELKKVAFERINAIDKQLGEKKDGTGN